MTAYASFASQITLSTPVNKHRRSLLIASLLCVAPVLFLVLYGANYYGLSQTDRPFSPKHHLLKPGGMIGINMGILGVLMLCAIFVYPLRKRWAWLRRQGNSRHWLDYHVVLGVAAPVFIAFHSSFKFRGVAGIAFWVMVAVAISGLVGRYLYSQIPRQVADAELSLRLFRQILEHQTAIPRFRLASLFQAPTQRHVVPWPVPIALLYVVVSDVIRPFRIAQLRIRGLGMRRAVASFGGLRPTNDSQLEWIVGVARTHSVLSNRILFLSQLRRVFQLWHVIHKPFSYAFAVLALFHIFVAMLMGFI